METQNKKERILNFLKEGYSVHRIAKLLNCAKSTVQYHLKHLEKLGYVSKVDYSWIVNKEERKVRKQKQGGREGVGWSPDLYNGENSRDIRSHAFQFSIMLPKSRDFHRKWGGRRDFLVENEISFKDINRCGVQRIVFRDHKVWLCNKKIIVYTPPSLSYFSGSAGEGRGLAVGKLKFLLEGLQNLLDLCFKVDGNFVFTVDKQHFAQIKNGLAKEYKGKGGLNVYDDKGLWLVIDDSFKLEELETVHKDSGVRDMDEVVKPFFNSLKEAPFTAYDFKEMYKITREMTVGYAENIKLHLATLQDMRDTLKEINRRLKK